MLIHLVRRMNDETSAQRRIRRIGSVLALSLAAVWMAPGPWRAPRSRSAVKTTVENGTQYKLSGYRDALDDLTGREVNAVKTIPAVLDSQWQAQVTVKQQDNTKQWTTVNRAMYHDSKYVYAWDRWMGNGYYPVFPCMLRHRRIR